MTNRHAKTRAYRRLVVYLGSRKPAMAGIASWR
jgi:hypothetical protein